MSCYCGNEKPYSECCAPLIENGLPPSSAEALMRSRYSAYVRADGHYLYETTLPEKRVVDDIELIEAHAAQTRWLKLEILDSREEGESGYVEFKAYHRDLDGMKVHHEQSSFLKVDGRWYYVEGKLLEAKIGRNDPCPCGSGKKFKKCCANM